MIVALWPASWSRPARSNATLAATAVLLVIALWALASLLSLLPEPIGNNAEQFSLGARTTLWLTVFSGAIGIAFGLAAALARTSGNSFLQAVARFYIWLIRGTPLLVQILFVYFALPVLVPAMVLPD